MRCPTSLPNLGISRRFLRLQSPFLPRLFGGFGYTALHWAAQYGNRRIVRKLIDAKRRRRRPGRWRVSLSVPHRPVGPAESRRLPCSATALHWAARSGHTGAIEELAAPERRRGRPGLRRVTLRCAAQPTDRTAERRTACACRTTPKQGAERCGYLTQYEAAERQVHEPARTPPRAKP